MTGLKNTAFNTSPPEELLRKMQNAKARRMNRFLSSHRLKNGEIRSVEVYSSPMLYNGKTYLYSIIHDITEKQRLEEELRSLSIDSALQAKILRSILENSSDYLYVFDREGNFRFVGKKGAELFKRTPEEMAGLSWKQLGIPEKRVAPLNEHLKQVFSTGKTKTA
jgi:PAS domain S-box